jgi:hypothetical protein
MRVLFGGAFLFWYRLKLLSRFFAMALSPTVEISLSSISGGYFFTVVTGMDRVG